MKSLEYLLMFTLMLTVVSLSALGETRVNLGIKGGVGISDVSSDDLDSALVVEGGGKESLSSFAGGPFIKMSFGGFAIQPEFNSITRGIKVERLVAPNEHAEVKMGYIEIPILLKYALPSIGKISPSLFTGPAVGVRTSAELTATDGVTTETWEIANEKTSSLALIFGGDIEIAAGAVSFLFDARYHLGQSQILEDQPIVPIGSEDEFRLVLDSTTGEAPDAKYRAFSFMFGVSYPLGPKP